MQAYIPSESLFSPVTHCHCRGVMAYENKSSAAERTTRIRNSLAKNQYFSAAIPDEDTFICTALPMAEQSTFVLERALADSSLSLLFSAEGKDFMGRLAAYLTDAGSYDDPEAAQAEIAKFYDKKRDTLKNLDAPAYLNLIESLAGEHSPAVVSAYLSHIGMSGLLSGHSDESDGRFFFLFNPRRDVVITEIIRTTIPAALSASQKEKN